MTTGYASGQELNDSLYDATDETPQSAHTLAFLECKPTDRHAHTSSQSSQLLANSFFFIANKFKVLSLDS